MKLFKAPHLLLAAAAFAVAQQMKFSLHSGMPCMHRWISSTCH
ncbi:MULTISPECIES: hypothetical protein [Comamonas]|uniref:Uncharacterized protein n=1 Tax=Comamonas testosteroni TaxID=285 RepID=A0A096F3A1_COMTE|nr:MULTISPECIES: hypothetical protein [Comamonas]KGH24258.1 hypothetical protein P353_27040 [Comamonas testosteroni]KWT68804.1 hypothetical protein APV28_2941 [Comamonas testosteroni]